MSEFLAKYGSMLLTGSGETLYMTFASTAFSYLIGLPLGVILTVTGAKGISPNRAVNRILGAIVNIGRSIPFIILMLWIIPLTRAIVGKAIGSTAAIVPLTVAAIPFVARMVESSLAELDAGVVEAAETMGASRWQIIAKVMLPESVPSLVRGFSITTITLLGYSAMAGACGGRGLGDIAIRYGYNRYQHDVMLATIVLLVIIVQIIQIVFNACSKRIDKRNR